MLSVKVVLVRVLDTVDGSLVVSSNIKGYAKPRVVGIF